MKKKISSLMSSLLFAGFVVPLDNSENWQVLKYSGIEANRVKFSKKGLSIKVDKSSNPVIYSFKKAKKIKSIRIKAQVIGQTLRFPAGVVQGSHGYDDFPLRVGLVKEGTRTLSWIERQFAPNWVNTLFKLSPKGIGVKNITYLNAVNQPQLLDSKRKHPYSDLIEEHFVTIVNKDGKVEIYEMFSQPESVLALWIAVDGDDTKTSYETIIEEIKIQEI